MVLEIDDLNVTFGTLEVDVDVMITEGPSSSAGPAPRPARGTRASGLSKILFGASMLALSCFNMPGPTPGEALVTQVTPPVADSLVGNVMKKGDKTSIMDQINSWQNNHKTLGITEENYLSMKETANTSTWFEKECEEAFELPDAVDSMVTEFEIDGDDSWVCEVFTDTERVKQEAEKQELPSMDSYSLKFGQDLRKKEWRSWVMQQVKEKRPKLLVIAFPCNPWSVLTHIQKDRTKVAQRRQNDRAFLTFVEELCQLQRELGGHYVVENQVNSIAWLEKPMRRLAKNGIEAVADQCAYGLKSPEGVLHKKRT
ncbi:MAG TPA: hypothetical protein EYQ31_01950, partial [Candidatus Handelsmanbacteria bacterium]|nr:hypothetical protein [Candidatus Handelsmanbacteria bacterium]